MDEPLVILLQFADGKYPEIKEEAFKSQDKEIANIVDFFIDVITRANKYKENTGHYPINIEDLKGWEELQF